MKKENCLYENTIDYTHRVVKRKLQSTHLPRGLLLGEQLVTKQSICTFPLQQQDTSIDYMNANSKQYNNSRRRQDFPSIRDLESWSECLSKIFLMSFFFVCK